MSRLCPVCGSGSLQRILEVVYVPVFCNVQLDSREEALSQPTGEMMLDYCRECTHIFNSAFDESLLAYSKSYENSLHYSGTFSRFAEGLANRLVRDFGLENKKIVDIGCGKGDFLSLICELGANQGYGFDRSYTEARARIPSKGSVQYFAEYFSPDYADLRPDLATCRHVLEHISNPREFLADVLGALRQSPGCGVYFEVPNALFTFRDLGIWDLIYEHCHYFTARSLSEVLAAAGATVDSVYQCYGRQFLGLKGWVDANPVPSKSADTISPEKVASIVEGFESAFASKVSKWRQAVESLEGRAVVWGGGSKGVTFLNLTAAGEEVAGVVDINPHKQHKYVPVSGHEILAPKDLRHIQPRHILVMNPLYEQEIEESISALGLDADIRIVN